MRRSPNVLPYTRTDARPACAHAKPAQRELRVQLAAAALLALALACLPARPARAADVIVQPPCTEAALRNAITQVGAAGTITLACPATPITIAQPLVIAGGKTVAFQGGGTVVLSGGGTSRLFEVAAGATLRLHGITLQQGAATSHGGAISNFGHLHLENSRLLNNRANGGAKGGAVASFGTLRIIGGTLQGNLAAAGGALYLEGTGTSALENVLLIANGASGNQATGGAIALSTGGSLTLTGGEARLNEAMYGGAVYIADGAVMVIEEVLFQGNRATQGGGGVLVEGALTVTNSDFVANNAAVGGTFRVSSSGELAITGARLSDGVSSISGAAIDNEGTLKLSQSSIERMTTSSEYAAVDNSGRATIVNSLFLDNVGADANSLHNHSTTLLNPSEMALIHVTILGRKDGGLAEIINNGVLTMQNSNFCTTTNDFTCFEGISPEAKVTRSLGGNFFSDQGCMIPKPTDTLGLCAPLIEQPPPDQVDLEAWLPLVDSVECVADAPVDIRGVPRPQGDRCDAGAFELRYYEAPSLTFVPLVKALP